MNKLLKKRIFNEFSMHAKNYDRFATVHSSGALCLKKHISNILPALPDGPFLEFGCGTGNLTQYLPKLLPNRQGIISDLSPEMLKICTYKMQVLYENLPDISFKICDAENLNDSQLFSLICSGMTIQWFQCLETSLLKMMRALKPGGFLACSFFADKSFIEWRNACTDLGTPCTANPLPNLEFFKDFAQRYRFSIWSEEELIPVTFPTARHFFHSLKYIGAKTSINTLQLNYDQMRSLINYWGKSSEITVTHHLGYVILRKPNECI